MVLIMNIKDFTLKVQYSLNGKDFVTSSNDDNLSFDYQITDNSLKVILNAKSHVKISLAEIFYDHYFESSERFFANGYQSWTTSKEYKKGDRQIGLHNFSKLPFIRDISGATGDYSFTEYGRDLFHSFSYTYMRKGEKVQFVGSLNERTGYTIFYADVRENVLAIVKDVDGVEISGEYELLNVCFFDGTYDSVFDKYFKLYPDKKTDRVKHLAGYTSWYNYYQNINEKSILRDLEGLKKVGELANIFQIDDGYEEMVGDWNYDVEKFPNGMRPIVDKIHSQGLLAGVWLAPFSAQFGSKLVEEHPDWLIRKPNGAKLVGGVAWNGFYVLDIEIPEVRKYIKDCFDRVFADWGFDMVKLDFLYSVCILPRNNKSRGQLMCEAMDFLRECVGDKIMLGCGVPLAPAFGKVDACRISCDVEFDFKERFYTKVTNAEIISTKSAINNSVFRRHLDGRIFCNDPDVFFLREDGLHKPKYTWEQKLLLAKVNNMFGNVLFVSDNVGSYDQKQLDVLKATFTPFNCKVISAEYLDNDIIRVVYKNDGKKYLFEFNLLTGSNSEIQI